VSGQFAAFAALLLTGALAASAGASWSTCFEPKVAAPEHVAPAHGAHAHGFSVPPELGAAVRLLEPHLNALAERKNGASLELLQDPELLEAAALLRDQLLAQAYVDRHRAELLRDSEVTEAELRAAYEEHKSEYVAAPTFTAHHLLVYRTGNPAFPDRGSSAAVARSRADAARRRLLAGESWDVVAREVSDDAGTRDRGGLMSESRWGLLPPSVEDVLRTTELGVPSPVIESPFGYHLVQVESRTLESTTLPFERVREGLLEDLGNARQIRSGRRFLAPLYEKVNLTRTEAGRSEAHLAARGVIPKEAVLATVGQRTVSEAELQGFVQSSVPPSQRTLAFARPHARQNMLTSYLDVIVLSEMARQSGLEREASFRETFLGALDGLLSDFAAQRPAPRSQ
jgi:hypothetical protein